MEMLIDTHRAVSQLIEKGIKKEQAEAFVEVFGSASENVATKQDLRLLESEFKVWMTKALLAQTLALIGVVVAILALI